MRDTLRKEFCWRSFGLEYHKPEALCTAQWKWPRAVFVIYRLLIAGYALFALSEYLVTISQTAGLHHNVMAFLTTWTLILENTFFVLGALVAVIYYIRPNSVGAPGLPRWENRHVNGNDHTRGEDNRVFQHSLDPNNPKQKNTENGSIDESKHSSGKGAFGESQGQNGNGESDVSQSINMGDLGGVKNGTKSGIAVTLETGNPKFEPNELDNGRGAVGISRKDRAAKDNCSMPWYVKVYWVVSNMIQVFAIVVTCVYFAALYKPKAGRNIPLHDINAHGINTVLLLIDVTVCARPVRLLHLIYPVIYGAAYCLFSIIYWSQDHAANVLYPKVLDWNTPGSTVGVVLGLSFIAIPLLQLMHFGIFRLRLFVYKQIYREDYL